MWARGEQAVAKQKSKPGVRRSTLDFIGNILTGTAAENGQVFSRNAVNAQIEPQRLAILGKHPSGDKANSRDELSDAGVFQREDDVCQGWCSSEQERAEHCSPKR